MSIKKENLFDFDDVKIERNRKIESAVFKGLFLFVMMDKEKIIRSPNVV